MALRARRVEHVDAIRQHVDRTPLCVASLAQQGSVARHGDAQQGATLGHDTPVLGDPVVQTLHLLIIEADLGDQRLERSTSVSE